MRGGARPGAGRKPKGELVAVRKVMDAEIGGELWEDMFSHLLDAACHGDHRAAALLLHYRFGRPVERSNPPNGLPTPRAEPAEAPDA